MEVMRINCPVCRDSKKWIVIRETADGFSNSQEDCPACEAYYALWLKYGGNIYAPA